MASPLVTLDSHPSNIILHSLNLQQYNKVFEKQLSKIQG